MKLLPYRTCISDLHFSCHRMNNLLILPGQTHYYYLHIPHLVNLPSNEHTNYFVPLVNVICAGKQYTTPYHFTHDTSNRPNIHILCVAHAQDDFGRSIIPRHHVRSHHKRGASGACQSKIQYFQCAIRLDDDVRWLQILFHPI